MKSDNEYYNAYVSYLDGHETEIEMAKLEPKFESYHLPEWLNGFFVTSGPSSFEMGKHKL